MLVEELFGFRKNLRYRKVTYEYNKIVSGINDTLYALGIFCDLAEVFHCVDRDI
jgi:hypothetical protein